MKIENFTSSNGNSVPNQFLITQTDREIFQSYSSIIGLRIFGQKIVLDKNKWDYSKTTGKYRNQFTGLNKKETEAAIKEGRIILADLSKLPVETVTFEQILESIVEKED